jgi:putative hydroxymethylpyrimidine transporter CytX
MSAQNRTSISGNVLLWLGAAISIAEILTGTLFAPLGWTKGLAAIVLGHLIGGCMLFLAGRIGAQTTRNAMSTMKIAFGEQGGRFFSVLNVLQLLGWTAVMIASGAAAVNALLGKAEATTLPACLVIGALIALWMAFGPQTFGRLNGAVVVLLAGLCLYLSWRIATTGLSETPAFEAISFGAAVELAVSMPLSWLPVISDYTSRARRPVLTNTLSNITYFIGSCWMFAIGMGTAIMTGYADLSMLMQAMGMGVLGLGIIILSTVTTTFLDARSAAISFTTLSGRWSERSVALAVTLAGTVIACLSPDSSYESFLYMIGSCFTPMVGVLLTEYYILDHKDVRQAVNVTNFGIWLAGFILYRLVLNLTPPCGITLPVVVTVGLLTWLVHKKWK